MSYELEVFYDGMCSVCSKEMAHYRAKDKDHKINFIDIAASDFDAQAHGLDRKAVNRRLHVKRPGKHAYVTGVESFAAIWDTLGIFRPLSAATKLKPLKPVFNLGYAIFADYIRPLLRKKDCEDNSCQMH